MKLIAYASLSFGMANADLFADVTSWLTSMRAIAQPSPKMQFIQAGFERAIEVSTNSTGPAAAMANEAALTNVVNFAGGRDAIESMILDASPMQGRSLISSSRNNDAFNFDYGCWCDFDGVGANFKEHGKPVDGFDQICKNAVQCMRCKDIDQETNGYDKCDTDSFRYRSRYTDGYYEFNCNHHSTVNEMCKVNTCSCMVNFWNEAWKWIDANSNHNWSAYRRNTFDTAQCDGKSSGSQSATCCGAYPNRSRHNDQNSCCQEVTVFNSVNRQCCPDGSTTDYGVDCPELEINVAPQYFLYKNQKGTFDENVAHCAALNMEVAKIMNERDYDLFADAKELANMAWSGVWIGARQHSDNEWYWVNSKGEVDTLQEVDYTKWHIGEPNNAWERCIEDTRWGHKWAWNDIPCTHSNEFACEVRGTHKNINKPKAVSPKGICLNLQVADTPGWAGSGSAMNVFLEFEGGAKVEFTGSKAFNPGFNYNSLASKCDFALVELSSTKISKVSIQMAGGDGVVVAAGGFTININDEVSTWYLAEKYGYYASPDNSYPNGPWCADGNGDGLLDGNACLNGQVCELARA
jgi:hypothetical protein